MIQAAIMRYNPQQAVGEPPVVYVNVGEWCKSLTLQDGLLAVEHHNGTWPALVPLAHVYAIWDDGK